MDKTLASPTSMCGASLFEADMLIIPYWRLAVQSSNGQNLLYHVPLCANDTPASLVQRIVRSLEDKGVAFSGWGRMLSARKLMAYTAEVDTMHPYQTRDLEAQHNMEVFIKARHHDAALTKALVASDFRSSTSDFIAVRTHLYGTRGGTKADVDTPLGNKVLLVCGVVDYMKILLVCIVSVLLSVGIGMGVGAAAKSVSVGADVVSASIGILTGLQALWFWTTSREY